MSQIRKLHEESLDTLFHGELLTAYEEAREADTIIDDIEQLGIVRANFEDESDFENELNKWFIDKFYLAQIARMSGDKGVHLAIERDVEIFCLAAFMLYCSPGIPIYHWETNEKRFVKGQLLYRWYKHGYGYGLKKFEEEYPKALLVHDSEYAKQIDDLAVKINTRFGTGIVSAVNQCPARLCVAEIEWNGFYSGMYTCVLRLQKTHSQFLNKHYTKESSTELTSTESQEDKRGVIEEKLSKLDNGSDVFLSESVLATFEWTLS